MKKVNILVFAFLFAFIFYGTGLNVHAETVENTIVETNCINFDFHESFNELMGNFKSWYKNLETYFFEGEGVSIEEAQESEETITREEILCCPPLADGVPKEEYIITVRTY